VKSLIVTADDFGLSQSLDAGIVEAHQRGMVSAASIMACGDAFESAAVLARQNPGLEIGIHLTLDDERPLISGLRTLVDRAGRFTSRNALVARLSIGRIDLAEVEACWRAEIRRVVDAGLRPGFVNSHGHIHGFPSLLPIARRLAQEFAIPAVRRPVEPIRILGSSPVRWLKDALVTTSARYAFGRETGHGPRTTDHFAGLWCSGRLNGERLRDTLGQLEDGVTELMTHPGRADADTSRKYGHWGYAWEAELHALVTTPLPGHITLTTFRTSLGGPA
jgi:predicted glycoside hydrolase/deacetylase ChbG (UPF0249 family)